MENKQLIALVIFLLSTIIVISVVAIAKVKWPVEMRGIVVVYGLYVAYPNGTVLHALDFGEMERDKNYTQNVLVVNNGTTQLTLSLKVPSNNWTNGTYGLIFWNRTGYILPAGLNVTATIIWQIKPTAPPGTITPIPIEVEGS